MANTLTRLIEAHDDEIREYISKCYEHMMRCFFRISEGVFIWDDGELEDIEQVGYPNAWIVPRNPERKVYNICNLHENYESWADAFAAYDMDNEEEAEEAFAEGMNWWRENRLDEIMEKVYADAESFEDEDDEEGE